MNSDQTLRSVLKAAGNNPTDEFRNRMRRRLESELGGDTLIVPIARPASRPAARSWRWVASAAAVLALLVGIVVVRSSEHVASPPSTTSNAAWGLDDWSNAYVADAQIVAADDVSTVLVNLEKRAGSPAGSEISPLAAPYGDGILYLAAPEPPGLIGGSLRFVDSTGEQLIDDNASSFTARLDGQIAVGRLNDKDSEVVVRATLGGAPETWLVSDENLSVLAWVGEQLLVQESFGDSGTPANLLAVTAGGHVRTVHSAAGLLAVSPDGHHLILDTVDLDTVDPASDTNEAIIVDAETFAQTGVLRLPQAGSELLVGQAEWSDEGIVATTWIDGEQRVAMFEPDGKDLVAVRAVPLPVAVQQGLVHPILNATGIEVSGWATNNRHPDASGGFWTSPYIWVTCNFESEQCTTAPMGTAAGQVSRVFSRSGSASPVNPVTSTSDSPTTPATSAQCSWSASVAGFDGAGQHSFSVLSLTNVSDRPCAVPAIAGVRAVDDDGTPLSEGVLGSLLPVEALGVDSIAAAERVDFVVTTTTQESCGKTAPVLSSTLQVTLDNGDSFPVTFPGTLNVACGLQFSEATRLSD